MRRNVRFFVSYSHRNRQLVEEFLGRLEDVLSPSKKHKYSLWSDGQIRVGEEWEHEIQEALKSCDFGLLLVSPAFLGSEFITEKELPVFASGKKPAIPVMLQPVDFSLHDLKGLEKRQIFLLNYQGFETPRAYGECQKQRRNTFVMELFKAIEAKLA